MTEHSIQRFSCFKLSNICIRFKVCTTESKTAIWWVISCCAMKSNTWLQKKVVLSMWSCKPILRLQTNFVENTITSTSEWKKFHSSANIFLSQSEISKNFIISSVGCLQNAESDGAGLSSWRTIYYWLAKLGLLTTRFKIGKIKVFKTVSKNALNVWT